VTGLHYGWIVARVGSTTMIFDVIEFDGLTVNEAYKEALRRCREEEDR